MNRTLATTGKGLLDAGNVIFKATFLFGKIVALVAILWFTGWLQETICFVLQSGDNKDDPLSSIQQRRNIIHSTVLRKYIGVRTQWYLFTSFYLYLQFGSVS